jgi:benzoate membrane transport protein
MKSLFNVHHMSAGFTAVLVGYASSVVIVIQAASSLGARASQIESWLLALGVVMGLTSIGFSWRYKMPILTAWSTPGAAMLAVASYQFELHNVVGGFVVSGLLIVLTGLIRPVNTAIKAVPAPLASAMLAGILLPFCVGAFEVADGSPAIFGSMFAAYLVTKKWMPRFTMLVVLLVGLSIAFWSSSPENSIQAMSLLSPNFAHPSWISPHFNLQAITTIALPLYLITMLSQNLPGIAMLKSYHYDPPIKSLLIGTGAANVIFAPFGGFSVNLAAISAAICMNEDVDRDRLQRYRAALWAGVFYLVAGLMATSVVSLFLSLPAAVTQVLAGLALLGTLLMCLQSAFIESGFREPALVTFLVTLSGISLFGMSSTLWGLLLGVLVWKIVK